MNRRSYYEDAYTTEFQAEIVAHVQIDGQPAVILDHTYFYPTSGGQQHDRGTLNGIDVVDVQTTSDDQVLHVLAAPLTDKQVHAQIDWQRRFDHMQQHSGQHLLSQTFDRLFALETVSVHFGDAVCTLDLDATTVSDEHLVAAENHANSIIWKNLPIRCYWVTDEILEQVPLRRPPKVSGAIRIVEIDAYDWSACGGTHVRHTGEIGAVALLRTERVRGQTRVHFVCGGRALADARARRSVLDRAAALLDAHYEQVPDRIEKMQIQSKEQEQALRSLQDEMLTHRAEALFRSARTLENVHIVAQALPDLDPDGLKGLAQALRVHPGTVALLACAGSGKGTALFARSDDLDLNVGQLLRDILRRHGGGGGGGPDFAQGGGMAADQIDAVIADAEVEVVAQLQTNNG